MPKYVLTILLLFSGYLQAKPIINLGEDFEIPVSTKALNNGLMSIPVSATVSDPAYSITSYSWTYNSIDSYFDDNTTQNGTFSNNGGTWTGSANTNFLARPYLGSHSIILTVTNSNAQITRDTLVIRVGEGLNGPRQSYYFFDLPYVHSYKYAAAGEPRDSNGYYSPKTDIFAGSHYLDVWDNERTGDLQPQFNMFSRIKFTTSGRYIVVRAATQWSSGILGISVNGIILPGIAVVGISDVRIDLGDLGTSKTVELVNGYQGVFASLPAKGTYVRGIISEASYPISIISPPSKTGRIFWFGDSLTGTQEDGQEFNSAMCILRYTYGLQVMAEAGGAIAFNMYTTDNARREDLKNLIIRSNPAKIWVEMGSNDWQNGPYKIAVYRNNFNAFWGEILTALPGVMIYMQTEYPRGSATFAQAWNLGSPYGTLDEFRQVKRDFVNAHPTRCVLVNGAVADGLTGLIHKNEWNTNYTTDGIHINALGHALMAPRIYSALIGTPVQVIPANANGYLIINLNQVATEIDIQFINKVKGTYRINLLNSAGQLLYNFVINNNGGSNLQKLKLPNRFPNGVYELLIFEPNNIKETKKFIINK